MKTMFSSREIYFLSTHDTGDTYGPIINSKLQQVLFKYQSWAARKRAPPRKKSRVKMVSLELLLGVGLTYKADTYMNVAKATAG